MADGRNLSSKLWCLNFPAAFFQDNIYNTVSKSMLKFSLFEAPTGIIWEREETDSSEADFLQGMRQSQWIFLWWYDREERAGVTVNSLQEGWPTRWLSINSRKNTRIDHGQRTARVDNGNSSLHVVKQLKRCLCNRCRIQKLQDTASSKSKSVQFR